MMQNKVLRNLEFQKNLWRWLMATVDPKVQEIYQCIPPLRKSRLDLKAACHLFDKINLIRKERYRCADLKSLKITNL